MGLMKLVVDSQTKRNVQRLTQTYLTLSLPDIASAVGLPSADAAELAILRCEALPFALFPSLVLPLFCFPLPTPPSSPPCGAPFSWSLHCLHFCFPAHIH